MRVILAGLAIAGCLVTASATRAEVVWTKPIRVIVPFTAGTGMDILARTLGEQLRSVTGQTIVVDNRAGASGNIGTEAAAHAPADGYTLMMSANTMVTNQALQVTVPYDSIKSFAPVAMAARGGVVLVAHPSLGAKTLPEFIALAKAKPGSIDYASPGAGTPQHLAMEFFQLRTGTKMQHIPYKGSAGAVQDVTSGQVKTMFMPIQTTLAQAASLNMLGLGSLERSPAAPNLPTIAEQGFPGFDVDLWYGLLAPVDTPKEIVGWLNVEINKLLDRTDVKAALSAQGLLPYKLSTDGFAKVIADDLERWRQVIKTADIKPE